MTDIVITGAPPYDGRYELNFERELTTREWGWIKRHAGYLPVAVTDEAFGDPELVCVLAVIAMRRAGRIEPRDVASVYDRLVDAPFGSTITVDTEPEQEEDAVRPPQPKPSSSAATSGDGSPTSSEILPPALKAIGTPVSAISAFAQETSAS